MEGKKTKKVTRKFLLDLANKIYDPESRRFLRLCSGTLQNGPDPTNEERSMHCGLGELYFAMTGRQPKTQDRVSDEDVVNKAIELSTLNHAAELARKKARQTIKDLHLPEDAEERMLDSLGDLDDEELSPEGKFREILEEIPETNDGVSGPNGNDECYAAYRSRAAKVARKLRSAALLLPQ